MMKTLSSDFQEFLVQLVGLYGARLVEIGPFLFVRLNDDGHCMTTELSEVVEFCLAKAHSAKKESRKW